MQANISAYLVPECQFGFVLLIAHVGFFSQVLHFPLTHMIGDSEWPSAVREWRVSCEGQATWTMMLIQRNWWLIAKGSKAFWSTSALIRIGSI